MILVIIISQNTYNLFRWNNDTSDNNIKKTLVIFVG